MCKDSKKEIKVTPFSNGDGAKIDIYSPSAKTDPHGYYSCKS